MSRPCATCPFLVANHGKRHRAGWYRKANLQRLWNGLRTGRAPGMICHSTDPDSIDYGGDKPVKGGVKRECIGATTLIQRELNALSAAASLREYGKTSPNGLTRLGAIHWVERIIFAGTPLGGKQLETADPNDETIGVP